MKEYTANISPRLSGLITTNYFTLNVDEKLGFLFSTIGLSEIYPITDKMKEFKDSEIRPRFDEFQKFAKNTVLDECSNEQILGAILEYDLYRVTLGHIKQDSGVGKAQHRITSSYLKRFLDGGNFKKSEGNGVKGYGHGLRGDFLVDAPNHSLYSNRAEETLALIEGDVAGAFGNYVLDGPNPPISLWDHIVFCAFFSTLTARTKWSEKYQTEALENIENKLLILMKGFAIDHKIGFVQSPVVNIVSDGLTIEQREKFSNIRPVIIMSNDPVRVIGHNDGKLSFAAPYSKYGMIVFYHKDHLTFSGTELFQFSFGLPGVASYRDPNHESIRMIPQFGTDS